MAVQDQEIAAALLALAARRGATKTLCPSEVARALGGTDWRDLMPRVRGVGARLVAEAQLVCTQKGAPVDPLTARGAIRFGQGPRGPQER